MSSLTIRRLIVWVVSMLVGTVAGLAIITFFLPAVSPDPNAVGVSVDEYGRLYFLTTVVPLGLIVMTWLDAFLDTRIWPD